MEGKFTKDAMVLIKITVKYHDILCVVQHEVQQKATGDFNPIEGSRVTQCIALLNWVCEMNVKCA